MNTYIQDKLDAILNKHTTQTLTKEGKPNTGLRLDLILNEVYELGQTDYHNHIVEQVRNISCDDTRSDEYYAGQVNMIEKVYDLLQDTNPKE